MYSRIKEGLHKLLSKSQIKSMWLAIVNNDIIMKIYLCFTFVLVLTGLLTGIIFIRLYRQNYLRSYTDLLTKQGHTIAKRVSRFERNGKLDKFQRYSTYIDEIENSENTDIWIISNEYAQKPLDREYTNAETNDGNLTSDMYDVINQAYGGKVASSASFDDVYGMATLRVAIPVYNKETGEVSGAIMMVSMIDKQTMGIDKGTYLILLSLFLSFVISYIVAFIF